MCLKNIVIYHVLSLIYLLPIWALAQQPINYKESLNNGLTYDMGKDNVLNILGKPDYIGDNEYWEATGNTYQVWEYTDIGLSLIIETLSDTSLSRIYMMEISQISTLCTSKNVCINSSKDYVIAQYESFINKELSNHSMIVIGDEYKGIYFYLQNEKVVKIVLGYVAE